MKSPQLILIQLQNNVERHKLEDLEECLTEWVQSLSRQSLPLIGFLIF
jgi:hypothetical protein